MARPAQHPLHYRQTTAACPLSSVPTQRSLTMTEGAVRSDTQDASNSRGEATDEDGLKTEPKPKLDGNRNTVSLRVLSRGRPLTRTRSDCYSIFSATTDDDGSDNQAKLESRESRRWVMRVTEEEREIAARLKEMMERVVDDEEEQAVAALLLGPN
ncbi:hypothetical protein PQX77_010713 [Marasmius sp. AFHP31]|nr:hypothetical protein PQX77_010713 [Marasmius sp. AFHP31]